LRDTSELRLDQLCTDDQGANTESSIFTSDSQ